MGGCIGRKTDVHINAVVPNQRFGQNNALLDKWSEQQVRLLNHKFNEYKTTEGLDFSAFEKLITDSSYLPKYAIKNLFKHFSIPGFDVLNFRNFCILIAQIFLSSKKEKSELVFKIFSEGNNEVWTENEKNSFMVSYRDFLKNTQKHQDFAQPDSGKLNDFVEWAMKHMDMKFIMKPFELIPSPDREKAVIMAFMSDMKPTEGLNVCIISSVWWEAWRNYVNFDKQSELTLTMNKSINNGDRPVAIDNSPLLLQSNQRKLRQMLKPDKDFIVIPELAWKTLHEWYEGGPMITRQYILQGKSLIIELHPPIFTIIPVLLNGIPSVSNHLVKQFSCKQKFQDVLDFATKSYKKPSDSSRIWGKYRGTFKVLNLNELIDLQKGIEDEILFESEIWEKNKKYWPRDLIKDRLISNPSNTVTASSSNSEDSKRNTEIKKMGFSKVAKAPGIVGLVNLGNTCYFNCIVQALIHTPLLQDFFANSNVLGALNKKVSENGSLALELSDLCKEVWTGNSSRLNPMKLYKEFTQRFSMFDDKNQHDCHEFLSMFLDTLHEELKREGDEELKSTVILENPENRQVEISESERQWQLLQGNQGSIITDMCAGQTKTTLTCGNCGSTRILFEIFTNLSLPIPYINSIPVYVTIVPMASNIVKIAIMASKQKKIKDFLDEISSFSNIPIENLLLFDSSYNLSYRTYDNSPDYTLANLGLSSKAELYAYEARKTVESCEEQGKRVKAYDVQSFAINSQVDILHGSGRWVPGRIKDINGENYLVEYDYIDGKDWKKFNQLQNFRSKTSYIDPTVYTIFITNVNASTRKRLGFPMAITIGSWYNLEDLYSSISSLLNKFCSKDLKPAKDPYKITVIDSNTYRCSLCKNPSTCNGCPLTKSRLEVRSIFMNTKKISILAEWDEKYFSEEIKHDSSVLAVKEKEKNMNKPIDIEMCLNEFTKEEKLEMKCEKCSNNSMKMKMEIWKTPDILILSFKRFTYSNGVIEKINSLVNFPFTGFDISQFVKSTESSKSLLSFSAGQNYYDLYAVVLHSGSVSSGHYTALVKLQACWILFDDDNLLELKDSPDSSNLLSSSYLLMYRRRRFSSSNVINLTYNSV